MEKIAAPLQAIINHLVREAISSRFSDNHEKISKQWDSL